MPPLQEKKRWVGNKCTSTMATTGRETSILRALSVWINKPHVVNRRLCGSTILLSQRFKTKDKALEALEMISKPEMVMKKPEGEPVFVDLSTEEDNFLLLLRELTPKSEFFPSILDVVLYDKEEKSVRFIPVKREVRDKLPTEELEYTVRIKENSHDSKSLLELTWSPDDEMEDTKNVRRQVNSCWLKTVLLEKLINWSEVNDISTPGKSLLLVSVDRYKDTYVRLKNTYGRELVKNWTEKTDPKKFVYEDVAIAAYLLLIWEEDRLKKNLTKKQSFVDLGCGNGLLVYILTKEGHRGVGIDLRRRGIWEKFGPGIDLREQAIRPSSNHLFPDYDWILGNHSDELTPWIPVIAARSSYTCNFFVLPCCPYDFEGKFSLLVKGKSQYGAYLDYMSKLVERCGFKPESDSLRIPSTKRFCFIGRERTYEEENEAEQDGKRTSFIKKRIEMIRMNNCPSERKNKLNFVKTISQDSGLGSLGSQKSEPRSVDLGFTENPQPAVAEKESHGDKRELVQDDLQESTEDANTDDKKKLDETSKSWNPDFKPREDPGVRNCQRVPEDTKRKIVDLVFSRVLSCEEGEKTEERTSEEICSWRKGGAIPLSSLVQDINQMDTKTLKDLKAEFGGLQTLLRNHSYIFQVSGGAVRLRDFSKANPWVGSNPKKVKETRDRFKTTECWFYKHHPDGCPRDSTHCTFAHGPSELRVK